MNTKDEQLLNDISNNIGNYPYCLELIRVYGKWSYNEGRKKGVAEGFDDACAGFIRGSQGHTDNDFVEDPPESQYD